MHASSVKASSAKETIRSSASASRAALPSHEAALKSSAIARALIGHEIFIRAKTAALYWAAGAEVSTAEVLDAAIRAGKKVYLPRVVKDGRRHLEFFRVESADALVPGAHGILEPVGGSGKAGIAEMDLVVVPGVAFDERGGRIGYGQGYYDRALAGVECEIVGLAYEMQMVAEVPLEEFDVRLTRLVTEKRVLSFKG